MDAPTTTAHIEYGNERFLIKRIATDRKDTYKFFSVPAFDYPVTGLTTDQSVVKLAINNLRKSWYYNATVTLPDDLAIYIWNFRAYSFTDLITAKGITRYNGGLMSGNKAVEIFSKFAVTDKFGRYLKSRPGNQWELEGRLKLANMDFNAVLVSISLYLFEMELIPMPIYYDNY